MKKKTKHTLTPKLRFPEFRDEPEWEKKSLNAISEVNPNHNGLPDSFVYIDLESVEQGKLVAQKVINRKGAPSRAQRLLRKRDVIYQTVRPYQRNNLFFKEDDGRDYVASTGYAQLRAHDSPAFLFQLLHTNDFVNRVLAKCTGSNYPAINSSDLAAIEVVVPSPSEQQKIAECLSSLDELIAAEGRKLEVLKAHKKGLMQQLFPQPGQSQPRLRFPEFRNKGEWENVNLGSICQIQRGKFSHRPRNDPKFFGGPYAFIQTGDVVRANGGAVAASQSLNELGLSVSKLFKPTIVLITIAANIGDTAILESEACFTDSVVGLIPKSDRATPRFLESIVRLKKEHLNQIATTGAQKNINNEILDALMVLVPSIDEQSRIEVCLSALDTQIATQASKIISLKIHKRGLMQQLFPAPEDN